MNSARRKFRSASSKRPFQQVEVSELREVPRLRFGIVRAGAIHRHPHERARGREVPLQLARIRGARIAQRRRAAADSTRRTRRTLRRSVRARGARRPPPRSSRRRRAASPPPCERRVERLGEAVLREQHDAEHALGHVVARIVARASRGWRVRPRAAATRPVDARRAHQRVGEEHGRFAVPGSDATRARMPDRSARRATPARSRASPPTTTVARSAGAAAIGRSPRHEQAGQQHHERTATIASETAVFATMSSVTNVDTGRRPSISGCRGAAARDTGTSVRYGTSLPVTPSPSCALMPVLNVGVSGVAPAIARIAMSVTSSPTRRPFGKPASRRRARRAGWDSSAGGIATFEPQHLGRARRWAAGSGPGCR